MRYELVQHSAIYNTLLCRHFRQLLNTIYLDGLVFLSCVLFNSP